MNELIIAVMTGFLGHSLERPINAWFDGGDAAKLASYTTGGMMILIAFVFIVWDQLSPSERIRAIGALCAALVGVGTGVTIAHVADGVANA